MHFYTLILKANTYTFLTHTESINQYQAGGIRIHPMCQVLLSHFQNIFWGRNYLVNLNPQAKYTGNEGKKRGPETEKARQTHQ